MGLHQRQIALKSIAKTDFKNKSVLDIGCGIGDLSIELFNKTNAKKWSGIDMDRQRVAFANELIKQNGLTNIQFIYSKADQLTKIGNSSVDIVFCNMAFQQFDDSEASLKEMKRVLKINGIAIINFNELKSPFLLKKQEITNQILNNPYNHIVNKKVNLQSFYKLVNKIKFSKTNINSRKDTYYYRSYKDVKKNIGLIDNKLTDLQNNELDNKFTKYLSSIKKTRGIPETWQIVFAKLTK